MSDSEIRQTLNIDTSQAESQIDRLLQKVSELEARTANIQMGFSSRGGGRGGGSGGQHTDTDASGFTDTGTFSGGPQRSGFAGQSGAPGGRYADAEGPQGDPFATSGHADPQGRRSTTYDDFFGKGGAFDATIEGFNGDSARRVEARKVQQEEDRYYRTQGAGGGGRSGGGGGHYAGFEGPEGERGDFFDRNRHLFGAGGRDSVDDFADVFEKGVNDTNDAAAQGARHTRERVQQRARIEREAEADVKQGMKARSSAEKEYDSFLKDIGKNAVEEAKEADAANEARGDRFRNFVGAAAYGVMRAGAQYMQSEAQEIATGTSNPQGAAGGFGGAAGGIAGAAIGTLVGGPFGPIVGARIGEQFGSAAGELTSAYSLSRNNVASGAFGYAYAHGQDPAQFFNADAQRNPLSLSGMDNDYLRNESGMEWIKDATLRITRLYNGTDQSSPEAQSKIAQDLGRYNASRGVYKTPQELVSDATAFAEDEAHKGQFAPGAADSLAKYGDARQYFGNSPTDIINRIGPEAYVSGARSAGEAVDPNSVYNYAGKQKYLDIDVRTDERNLKASEIALQGTQAAGGYADPSLYAGVESNLRDKITDLTRKLGEEIKMAGESSEGAGNLRNAIAETYAQIGANAKASVMATLGYEQSGNAVSAANTAFAGTQAALFGGAGSFGNLVGQQQSDIDAQRLSNQKAIDKLPDGPERNRLIAQNMALEGQRLGLAAGAQAQDIGRGDLFDRTAQSQSGVEAARAGVYGDAADIGRGGQGRLQANQAERQRLQGELSRAQSVPIQQSLKQRLARLDADDLGIVSGVQGAQGGIEDFENNQRIAGGQFDVGRAGAYGSDDEVANAYGTLRSSRQSRMDVLKARANDNSLPRAMREQAQREMLSQQSAMQGDTIQGNDTLIHREDQSAGLRRQDTQFDLNKATKIGTAGEYRQAVAGDIGELQKENADIATRLQDPTLTVDQRARLQGKQKQNTKSIFDEGEDSIDRGYAKEDAGGYDIDRIRLGTARSVAHSMPFGVGNTLAMDMAQIGQNRDRHAQLQGRYDELKRKGELSPERMKDLESQDASLTRENASIVGELGRGMENYLPGLSSGAPTRFANYNTLNMAAYRTGQMGGLAGNYGFAGGGHEQWQRAVMNNLTRGGGTGITSAAPGGGNLPGMGGQGSAGLENAIRELSSVIRSGGGKGNGIKSGEAQGMLNGMLAGQGGGSPVPAYRGR